MKIQVFLYGTLRKGFDNHDRTEGLHVELPDGTGIEDLIDRLELSRAKLGAVSVNGILVKKDAKLTDCDCVRIYQPIFGG